MAHCQCKQKKGNKVEFIKGLWTRSIHMCYKSAVVHIQVNCAVLVNEALGSVLVRLHRESIAKILALCLTLKCCAWEFLCLKQIS